MSAQVTVTLMMLHLLVGNAINKIKIEAGWSHHFIRYIVDGKTLLSHLCCCYKLFSGLSSNVYISSVGEIIVLLLRWMNCTLSLLHITLPYSLFHVSFTHFVGWNDLCRYLLRRSALELFMVDRSNFFFDFGVHP